MPTHTLMPITSGYEADIVREATAICDWDLSSGTQSPRLIHLRGLLLARQGQHRTAIPYLKRAVRQDPKNATYLRALGQVLVKEGYLADAVGAYLRALALEPDRATGYMLLSRTLRKLGKLDAALTVCRQALRLSQTDPRVHAEIANVLAMKRHYNEAIVHYTEQVRLAPSDDEGYSSLGQILVMRGQFGAAIAQFEQGLQAVPRSVLLNVGLGEALLNLGRTTEALKAFRRALTIDPAHEPSLVRIIRAVAPAPRAECWAEIMVTVAHGFRALCRYDDAVTAYQHTLTVTPDSVEALNGLGHVYLAVGEPTIAAGLLERVLASDPNHTAAHMALGSARHLVGDSDGGWNEFAEYYNAFTIKGLGLEQPLWDGSPLEGRTILLWTDMGRGDVIQFLRYIPYVVGKGGRVVVESNHHGLVPLIERLTGVDRVLVAKAARPSFDVHVPLVMLPALIRAARVNLPDSVPYLTVPLDVVEKWSTRLGSDENRAVGLSWGGNTQTISSASRFVPLSDFAPLGGTPGVRFVNLQHGPQWGELLDPPAHLEVMPLISTDSSIVDAAALIMNLDLVITVDTMIAHLAGALGRPVWTLLRRGTNWRWQIDGDRTPWYPTMRLFRQVRPGDWISVLNDVRFALEEWRRV